jgi:hypothetical protein
MHEACSFQYRSMFLLAALLVAASSGSAFAYDRDGDGRRDHVGSLMLAIDFDYASAIQNDVIEKGGGGALRVGSQVDLLLVTLIPEVTLDYHDFGADTRNDAALVTGKVGGRIRFFKIIEPGIFAHIGLGSLSGDSKYSHIGAAFDMGVTLDLTILPLLDLGLHAAWNRVFGGYDSGLSYGTSGFHIALVL